MQKGYWFITSLILKTYDMVRVVSITKSTRKKSYDILANVKV